MTAAPSTADAILQSARSAIIAGGYTAFSYADIAAVVGIRKASIHHHFPTKVELVRELVKRYRAEAVAGLAEIDEHTAGPLEALHAYTGYWEACIGEPETSYCLCALLATQIPVLPDAIVAEVQEYFRALSGWLTATLARGVDDGVLTLTDTPEIEAEALMATVHGAMLAARTYGDAGAFAAIVRPALQRLRTGRT